MKTWMLTFGGRVLPVLPVLAGSLAMSLPAHEAQGQQRIMARSFVGSPGGGGGNQIGTRSVEKYARILGLSDEQRDLVKQLHEGYQATFRGASEAMQKELAAASETYEETQDGSVFAEKIPAARKTFREQTVKAEAEFFADLKQVLNESQTGRWEYVERARRRETILRGGTLSGESVDLVEIVEGLNLKDTPKPVVEELDAYEIDLDRALLAKQAASDKYGEFEMKPGAIDLTEIQKRSAEAKEMGSKIKDVNQQHARKIETLLPEDVQPAFAKAVKRQSFPRVYKPSQVGKSLEAALKLDDLDSGQRDTLRSIRDSYEREVGPLNEAWAAAVEQDEKDPNNMTLGDGSFSISISGGPGGDQDESPLAKARKARREFDDKTRDRLSAALTPAQREKLPKPSPASDHGETDEDVDMIVAPGAPASGTFIFAR